MEQHIAVYTDVISIDDPVTDSIIKDLKVPYPQITKEKIRLEVADGYTYFYPVFKGALEYVRS